MVTEPTARQRPQPVPAIVAATAGLALALFGSAPAAAEPPGVPAGASTQGAQRHDQSYPRVPSWLDPAREPLLRAEAVPAREPGDPPAAGPAPPAEQPTHPVEEPTGPADEPTPPTEEPTPPAAEPSQPAAEPVPPKPKPSPTRTSGRPNRTENHPNPAPPPAAYQPPADDSAPAEQAQSGQGGELAVRPITEVPDTRGLDERVPTVLPSPTTPPDPSTATRLASSAADEEGDGFARSLTYSGLIGLAIALYGLSMVGRRRRTW